MSQNKQNLEVMRLSRGLSLWQAMSRGLGLVLVTSLFVLLGDVTAVARAFTPLTFLATALLILLNSLGYAELAISTLRPGGAYTLVKESTGSEALAFLTGWTLFLSETGLAAIIAVGAARHLTALSTELLGLSVASSGIACGLAILVTLIQLVRSRNTRSLRFTAPIILTLAIIAIFMLFGPVSAQTQRSGGRFAPAITSLLIAFAGIELIANNQREIRRHLANVPRALLLPPAIAAAIGIGFTAVVLASVGVQSLRDTTLPMSAVLQTVAGIPGQIIALIVGFATLTISLDYVIRLITRQLYVMCRDGFWPGWMSWIHPRRGTPSRLTAISGLAVGIVVWMPFPLLTQAAGLMYLSVLIAVNLTLALRSRSTVIPAAKSSETQDASTAPDVESDTQVPMHVFALPFHPWIPAVAVAVNLLVVTLWSSEAIAGLLLCLIIGYLIYLVYGRRRHIDSQEGITVFKSADSEQERSAYRILVPLANPNTAEHLLRLAVQLAQANGGEVLALQVTVVPETMPLETGRRQAKTSQMLLEHALDLVYQEHLPIRTITRAARTVPQGILETAVEEETDLIIMGWRDPARGRITSLGSITDAVLRDAPCEVIVIHGEHVCPLKRILVPTAGGPHAEAAARLAVTLSNTCDTEITFVYVQTKPLTPDQLESAKQRILERLEALDLNIPPSLKIVSAGSVVEGIISEAQGHDFVLIGVSEETLLDKVVFGSIPLQVMSRVSNAGLVQGDRGVRAIWTRRLLRLIIRTMPQLSNAEQLDVQQNLLQGARPGVNYFVLIVLSCVIAAVGLLLNSPAVVIGAMLVAPLMSPILAFSIGMVVGDLRMIRFSWEAIFKGVVLALVIAAFIGLIAPIHVSTAEMLARAEPSLLDLVVALASGMAGAYAIARKDVSAALPGVSIAAALMPPLATVGLGLAMGDMRVAGGALLLFVTNIAAISLAGGIVFLFLGIRPQAWGADSRKQLQKRLIASTILLLVIAIPLGVVMARTIRESRQRQIIEAVLVDRFTAQDSSLVELGVAHDGTRLLVAATVRSADGLDSQTANDLAGQLTVTLNRPVTVELVTLPLMRSDVPAEP
ncbi:MAG: TIGR00341 family protein [Chloroflexi bacterium]|nr:TIGR00341 family protein [Chloroflexota bacterium]